MKLLTVGDSFTYGEELAELTSAWPNLLADQLSYELINLARPGSGNTRMVRNCIEQINNYDLVIIAWSHFARFETADENGFYDLWPGCDYTAHKEYSPWRKELIDYTNRHHSDKYLYNQYLLNIVLLQNYLKNNNKQYLMLDSFGNHQGMHRNSNELIKQIDTTTYLGWPNESMMEWTYCTAQGPRGHFLEEGHAIVANKIYEYIRNISRLS
jgi:lysophospholipase L1-like esterase